MHSEDALCALPGRPDGIVCKGPERSQLSETTGRRSRLSLDLGVRIMIIEPTADCSHCPIRPLGQGARFQVDHAPRAKKLVHPLSECSQVLTGNASHELVDVAASGDVD